MDKYLCAVGDLVGDEKMVFAGKNNDLVKIYLASEADVEKLYENHPQITIDDKPLIVKKLVDSGHKVFLCNVEPGVPDSVLINELAKYTKMLSPMKFVNLGCRNERFTHLIGFRRTVLVETIDDLPPFFNLFYDNTNYKIFVVIDKVKCFNCNAEGHLIKNCPVKNVSVQNRLDPSFSAPSPRNDANTSTFLPAFASKTPTTAVTPLPDVAFSSKVAKDDAPSVLNLASQDQASVSVEASDLTPPQGPSTTTTESVLENPATQPPHDNEPIIIPDTPMETNQDMCKKRARPQSPPLSNGDKKPCVTTKSELQCLVPVIEKCEPSIDASVFVDLVQDLKNSKKKLEVIKDDYEMDPNMVISVLENIVSDESNSIATKVKNRLKNLRKSLITIVSANLTTVNPGTSDPVFSDSDIELSQI
ncbi:hypothetical protein M8J77_007681 [Diaphorina citri]|nr:hypothetical protein M8J77_007681 [Diaphorina citri]